MSYLKNVKPLVVWLVISVALVFASNEYYTSALNAYISGNYEQALQWFEKAVQIEPSLESYDSLLKLKMGICAFAIGDLQKAKTYLEQYQNTNPISKQILALIKQGTQPTEEWMTWIRARIPQTTPTPTELPQKKGVSLLLIIGVFVVSFSVSFLAMYLLKKRKEKKVRVEVSKESTEQKIDVETQVESSISEVEKLVQEISTSTQTPVVESDEKFKEIEAQLDSIVQEILSKEKPKEETRLSSQDDPFEILKKLEEKTAYDEEDAKVLSDLMNKIINTQGKSQGETEH
ncbi:tetratricopeptide repeat protein [Thermotoga profunda]|uniref:tetratricopeptide repeat protein n=1 Tax=Thermotoga profunda TaxID=1508420 RepID=UPI000693D370|nr:tetratricopeptide repeat protein [Thermotoga profunda]